MVHPMMDARNGHPIMKNHDSHLHGGAHSLKETLRPHQIELVGTSNNTNMETTNDEKTNW